MRIDLHRHLGGSIKPHTIHGILRKQGNSITLKEVTQNMNFQPEEKFSFQKFLSKFQICEAITWDAWAIKEVIQQVCYDIARERIDYCELKFTIDKYLRYTKWTGEELISYIHHLIEQECDKWDIHIALVLCLKYESKKETQRKIASLIENPTVNSAIIGIDLVGDEKHFSADFYEPLIMAWKSAGKGVEAHVGESQNAENVRAAIERLGVNRIAHGIKAANHPDILKIAKERDICFDTALTSNLYTGIVPSYQEHPVKKLIEADCKITLGTDDPAILKTNLDIEYAILQETFKLEEEQLLDIMQNSYDYAFTDLKKLRETRYA